MTRKIKGLQALVLIAAAVSIYAIGIPSEKTSIKKKPAFRVIAISSKAKDHLVMIAATKAWLEKIGADNNFTVDVSNDTSLVNDKNLANYQVFIQLQEAAFDMAPYQQAALQKFVNSGKGWVGIHCAGLTGKEFVGPEKPTKVYWQWFEDLMGNVLYSPHPKFQKGTLLIEDHSHPVTQGLPDKMEMTDEWYEWDKSVRLNPNVQVLARADESTYKQNKPMGDHPMIWTNKKFDRMIYICVGHDSSVVHNKDYTRLIQNSILWAASKPTKAELKAKLK